MRISSYHLSVLIAMIFLLFGCLRLSVGFHTRTFTDPDGVIKAIGGFVKDDQIGLSLIHCVSDGLDSCTHARFVGNTDAWSVYFPDTHDSLRLDTVINERHYFTCDAFEEKFRNNKTITVMLSYHVDSNEVRLFRVNTYTLYRSENLVLNLQ